MLSVCIPIHEHDVRELLAELTRQVREVEEPVELVLIDDASSPGIRACNEEACRPHTYLLLEENHGRARIRNLFPKHARYEALLYLDCDSLIVSKDFLSNYQKAWKESSAELICGGRIYPQEAPGRERILSWKYGMERETALDTDQDPYRSFMTNNFLVHRNLIEDPGFDEWIDSYGHEDTLFGYRLKKRGVRIERIDNPVLNGHIEKNGAFLEKTEEGIANLLRIEKELEADPDFVDSVRILSYYERLREKGLLPFLRPLLYLSMPLLRWSLKKGYAGLRAFALFKLGLLLRYKKRLQEEE